MIDLQPEDHVYVVGLSPERLDELRQAFLDQGAPPPAAPGPYVGSYLNWHKWLGLILTDLPQGRRLTVEDVLGASGLRVHRETDPDERWRPVEPQDAPATGKRVHLSIEGNAPGTTDWLRQMRQHAARHRRPGWYRVKFTGRWHCIEWKDPAERRGGWQFGDKMDPQPWEDRHFDEIGTRVIMPGDVGMQDARYDWEPGRYDK